MSIALWEANSSSLCTYIKIQETLDLQASFCTASRCETQCLNRFKYLVFFGTSISQLINSTMPSFLSNTNAEGDLGLIPAPLAPAKRVRIATALAPSRSATVNNKDSLRKLYLQKSTLNRAIENTIDDYAGLGSPLPTVAEMKNEDPLTTISVDNPRPLVGQSIITSLKDELTKSEQERCEMDTDARVLASTYQMIHRIEKEIEISQHRRQQRAGKKHGLTPSAGAHKNATACADSEAASSGGHTVKAAYTPPQRPTLSIDDAFNAYRISYPVYPRRFSDAISPTSLPNSDR